MTSSEYPDISSSSAVTPAPKPKRKKRVFLWVFLVIQALFLLWLIGGLSADAPPCDPVLSQEACDAARGVGGGIAIALIFGLWVGVDIILGVGYGIYRLATRPRT